MSPQSRPIFNIEINGSPQRDLVSDVQRIEVEDSIISPSMFSFEIADREREWLDKSVLNPDTVDVKIYMGYVGGEKGKPLITGRVLALSPSFSLEGPTLLTVQGFDHSSLLQRTFQNRDSGFKDQTLSNIASTLARNIGLRSECDPTKVTYKSMLANLGESDYTFLRRMAGMIGYDFYVRDKILHFQKPKYSDLAGTLSWRRDGGGFLNGVSSVSLRLSAAKVVKEIQVRGYDPKKMKPYVSKVSPNYKVNVTPASKSSILEQNMKLATQEEINDLSRARADGISHIVDMEASLVGDPSLRAGATLKVEGIGERFSGNYYITKAKHAIGDEGYTLKLELTGPV